MEDPTATTPALARPWYRKLLFVGGTAGVVVHLIFPGIPHAIVVVSSYLLTAAVLTAIGARRVAAPPVHA